MILTPEDLIKQYFPEPIETTRALYDRLELEETQYPYLNWLQDAEKHCLAKFAEDVDYKLLPDGEKNYWINQGVFWTLVQTSPSKICDQIRAGLTEFSNKMATDRAFARQMLDRLDQQYGIEKIIPKVSKKLRSKYNEKGQDVFEFSIQSDSRLYLDIISGYNFQPGEKIKDVYIFFRLETENGVPYHIVDISLSIGNGHTFSYRTIWSCSKERQRYGAILRNRVIRVNLFEDNNKLVDSFDYILSSSDIKNLELELEKVIGMLLELKPDEIDVDEVGEKILARYNLNDQAYALAIKKVIPTLPKFDEKNNAETTETAFLDAIRQYWEYYVLRPDPAKPFSADLEQMVQDRIPGVTLGLIVANMINYDELCDKYFQRRYSKKQKQVLLNDGNLRLIYALSAADFDPTNEPDKQAADMCAFIIEHLDLIKKIAVETGQWP